MIRKQFPHQMFIKKLQFPTFIDFILINFLSRINETSQHISSKYCFMHSSFWKMLFSQFMLLYLYKFHLFIVNLILLKIHQKYSIFLIFSEKKPNHSEQTFFHINYIIIFLSLYYFWTLNEPKPQISIRMLMNKFYQKATNLPIGPLLWLNDNIWGNALRCEKETLEQGRSYQNNNINIDLCFFSRSIEYTEPGGVIYINVGGKSMNINVSMFYNCVTSDHGGAIYFNSLNSCLRMICANRCSCGNQCCGLFGYLIASQVNKIEYLSVSHCYHTATNGRYPIYLRLGDQRVDNTNSSMNNAYLGSGISFRSPSSFTSSHCTFSNNKVTSSNCLEFDTGTISMSSANIVHNNSPNQGVVYVTGDGSIKLLYCIFKNNQNRLFYIESGSLEVSHSFIDHTGQLSTSTSVSTALNNSFTQSNTYQIQFFKSYYCYAQIPVPIPSPRITLYPSRTATLARTQTLYPSRTATLARTQTLYPSRTLNETPMNTLNETPKNTIEDTPKNTIEDTPMNTIEDTPMNTIEDTPMNTIEDTPMNTLNDTPMNTLNETPMNTLNETPKNTIEDTPMNTLNETPMNTLNETPTPKNTHEETPMITLVQTMRESPKETIPRTYAECVCSCQITKRKQINVIFSFALLFPE